MVPGLPRIASTFIPLIATACILLVVYILMIINKIEVPCFACDRHPSQWWSIYKCKTGTGCVVDPETGGCRKVGTCKRYLDAQAHWGEIVESFDGVKTRLQTLPSDLATAAAKAAKSLASIGDFGFVAFFENMISGIVNKVTQMRLPSSFSCDDITLPKVLRDALGLGSFNFCDLIRDAFNSALGGIGDAVDFTLRQILTVVGSVETAINNAVVKPIKEDFVEALNGAMEPFMNLKESTQGLLDDMANLIDSVKTAWDDIIYLNMANFMRGIFGDGLGFTVAIFLAFMIFIIIPVIGGFYGFFSIFKDIGSGIAMLVS